MILLREECEESNKKKKKPSKIIKRKKVEDLGKLEKQGTRNLELKRLTKNQKYFENQENLEIQGINENIRKEI